MVGVSRLTGVVLCLEQSDTADWLRVRVRVRVRARVRARARVRGLEGER